MYKYKIFIGKCGKLKDEIYKVRIATDQHSVADDDKLNWVLYSKFRIMNSNRWSYPYLVTKWFCNFIKIYI